LRIGAPPYRFNGQCLARTECRLADGQTVFVALWQRQKGGYTVAFSARTADGWRDDARQAADVGAAMALMETVCAELQIPPTRPVSDLGALSDQVLRLVRDSQDIDAYRKMVGHALDRWRGFAVS
jgi:hypothetical protein